MEQPPKNPFAQVGIILLVCAALLSLGLATKAWGTATEGRATVGAGLFGLEGCSRSTCEEVTWEFAEARLDIPGIVTTLRIPGLILGVLAALGMALAGALALRGEAQKIPVAPIASVTGGAAVVLTFFATQLAMADQDVNFGPGYSAVVGIGAALAGSMVIQKMLKPLLDSHGMPAQAAQHFAQAPRQDAQPFAHSSHHYGQAPQQHAQQAPQFCPRCGQPQTYWAEQQRYYCTTCRA